MARQYNRKASLIIASTSSTGQQLEVQGGIEIKELRFRFELIKDLQGYPNLFRVEVYNLSRKTRQQIEDEFDTVFFNVGYENNVKLLFNGTIKNVTHSRRGPDSITTIYAGDGQKDFEESYSAFTLAEGATVGDIIKRTIADFKGLAEGFVEGVNLDRQKVLGFSATGPSNEILDNLAAENNFNWFVENGKVNILAQESIEPVEFRISAATGMLESPAVTEIGADVSFLLNPEVLPGRVINIESVGSEVTISNLQFRQLARTSAQGRHKVIKCTYTGDTHSDEWRCTAVGRRL